MEQFEMAFQTHFHWHQSLWTVIHLVFLGIYGTLAPSPLQKHPAMLKSESLAVEVDIL